MTAANAVQYTYIIEHNRNPQIKEDSYLGWLEKLHEMTNEWAKTTEHVTIHLFSTTTDFDDDMEKAMNQLSCVTWKIGLWHD